MNRTFHPVVKEYHLVKGYIENNERKLEYTSETFSRNPAAAAFKAFSCLVVINHNVFSANSFPSKKILFHIPCCEDKSTCSRIYGIMVDDQDGINTGGIGCADCDSITAKRKKLKEIISNDNNQLRSLFRKNNESITLKQIDNIELKSILKNVLQDGICSQRKAGEDPPHDEEFINLYGEEKCKKIKEYKLKKAH